MVTENDLKASNGPGEIDTRARLIPHPRRPRDRVTGKQTLHRQPGRQKQSTTTVAETYLSKVDLMRTGNDAGYIDAILNGLLLALEEIQMISPVKAPYSQIFSGLCHRVEQAFLSFVYGDSAAFFDRLGSSQNEESKR